MKYYILTFFIVLSSYSSECILEKTYQLKLCVYDRVVNLKSVSGHVEDERTITRGEIKSFTEEGAVVVKMTYVFSLGNENYATVELDDIVDPKSLAVIKYPIANKYPGDFYKKARIHETLYKGEVHPGLFITTLGLIKVSSD